MRKYFRLRQYDKVWLLSCSLSAFWSPWVVLRLVFLELLSEPKSFAHLDSEAQIFKLHSQLSPTTLIILSESKVNGLPCVNIDDIDHWCKDPKKISKLQSVQCYLLSSCDTLTRSSSSFDPQTDLVDIGKVRKSVHECDRWPTTVQVCTVQQIRGWGAGHLIAYHTGCDKQMMHYHCCQYFCMCVCILWLWQTQRLFPAQTGWLTKSYHPLHRGWEPG